MAVGLLGLFPGSGSAQQKDETLPEKGSYSILFGLPSGGATTFGIWRMMGDRLNLGFDVELEWEVQANGNPLVDSTRWRLATFHSALGVQIYF